MKALKQALLENPFVQGGIYIFTLWNFSVTQPLFDLLSRFSEFFPARQSLPVDIYSFVWVAFLAIPLVLVATEGLTLRLLGRKAYSALHTVLLLVLGSLLFIQVVKLGLSQPGWLVLLLGVLLGSLLVLAIHRVKLVGMFLSVLAILALVYPVNFLYLSPVRKLVRVNDDGAIQYPVVRSPIPVVMVVFDELPITSLMNANREIDSKLYPNFAALAAHATWFRNATAVSHETKYAVPAILSGRYATGDEKPKLQDYPHNVFTYLGGSYRINAMEARTQLCPDRLCRTGQKPYAERIRSLFTDLTYVYLHMLLPQELTVGLPDVTRDWTAFGQRLQPATLFRQFVSSLQPSEQPTLHFLHIVLPHVPWTYLPSGREYDAGGEIRDGMDAGGKYWLKDDWIVTQGYQRHLMQLTFADKLLGELIAKLKAQGVYDQALIILVADHGISFRPGDWVRGISQTNYPDVLAVPLLVKRPGQQHGDISDKNVETIDVLPTIADVLDTPLPWPVEGQSVFEKQDTDHPTKTAYFATQKFVFPNQAFQAKYQTLARKLALFGTPLQPADLYRLGPHDSELLGRPVLALNGLTRQNRPVEIDRYRLSGFDHLDLSNPVLPCRVTGTVSMKGRSEERADLALAVNGVVQAVTHTWPREGDKARFSFMVPETAYRNGANRLEVFAINKTSGKELQLVRLALPEQTDYSLTTKPGANGKRTEWLKTSDGRMIPVASDQIVGQVESHYRLSRSNRVEFKGWIEDQTRAKALSDVLVFVDGRFFYAGQFRDEQGKEEQEKNTAIQERGGFAYYFPVSLLQGKKVRFFVLADQGPAYELNRVNF